MENFIQEKADNFINRKINNSPGINRFIDELKKELSVFIVGDDAKSYLSYVYDRIETNRLEHAKECENPSSCRKSIFLKESSFFVGRMLQEKGLIKLTDDQFSDSEKEDFKVKLDLILKEIEKLKMGQEAIYDDLYEEIENLSSLFFLGKKNWKQLFAGKLFEMTASGVISESLSKEIIKIIGENLPLMIY